VNRATSDREVSKYDGDLDGSKRVRKRELQRASERDSDEGARRDALDAAQDAFAAHGGVDEHGLRADAKERIDEHDPLDAGTYEDAHFVAARDPRGGKGRGLALDAPPELRVLDVSPAAAMRLDEGAAARCARSALLN
jgi:hypothetical protein